MCSSDLELLATYPLTERELEVLELMVAGCTNIAIAEKLFITAGTVKTHVRNILGKLCADDRTEVTYGQCYALCGTFPDDQWIRMLSAFTKLVVGSPVPS